MVVQKSLPLVHCRWISSCLTALIWCKTGCFASHFGRDIMQSTYRHLAGNSTAGILVHNWDSLYCSSKRLNFLKFLGNLFNNSHWHQQICIIWELSPALFCPYPTSASLTVCYLPSLLLYPPLQPSTLSLKARHTTAFWWPLYSLLISPVSTHHRRARLSEEAADKKNESHNV